MFDHIYFVPSAGSGTSRLPALGLCLFCRWYQAKAESVGDFCLCYNLMGISVSALFLLKVHWEDAFLLLETGFDVCGERGGRRDGG